MQPAIIQREAVLRSTGMPLPDFDSRVAGPASSTPNQAAQNTFLQQLGVSAQVAADPRTGTIRHAFRTGGFLTGPLGTGSSALTNFLTQNAAAYGLSPADIQGLVQKSLNVDAQTGVTHVLLQQQIGGIRVFEGMIKGHVSARGEIVSVESAYYPGVRVSSLVPRITANDAIQAALRDVAPDILQKHAKAAVAAPANVTLVGGLHVVSGQAAASFPALVRDDGSPEHNSVFEGIAGDPIRAGSGYSPADSLRRSPGMCT